MYKIDNQKFGALLVLLRKEKGFTQKELADRLYVSDKAVSKWERGLFWLFGVRDVVYWEDTLLVVSLFTLFGGWFSLFAPEVLPGYYDQNRISAFSSGIFRMNLPGVRFHNGNWPYILRAGRLWCLIALALFPVVYFLVRFAFLQLFARQLLSADVWRWLHLLTLFPATLGLLAAMTVAGIRHK